MKKDVKEYVRYTMIGTIMIYVVVIFLFCMASLTWFNGILKIISIIIGSLIILSFFHTVKEYLHYKKENKQSYYEEANKELSNPILFQDNNYILTDNYIINLKNGHIFKYDEITTIYKKIGFGGFTYRINKNNLIINNYLYIKTKSNDCDRYVIDRINPVTIGEKYNDIGEIIKKKNPFVNDL